MASNRGGTLTTTAERLVPATPEVVIAALADPARTVEWMLNVEEAESVAADRARVTHRMGRRRSVFELRQSDRTPRSVSFVAVGAPFSFQAALVASPASEGARIVYTRIAGADGAITRTIFRALGHLLRRLTRREMARELDCLAALLSQEPGKAG